MGDLDDLRRRVHRANLDLVRHGLVLFTWGNASAVDRDRGLLLIKPSGVDYDTLLPEHIVAVRLDTGEAIREGSVPLKPSSDTPTHVELYRRWPAVGGIVHTHSLHATAVAQAGCGIPAQGTTHADYFHGDVPVTRQLTPAEVAGGYEAATGAVIAERFAAGAIDPLEIPGVLVAGHAPFAWGATVEKAVHHAAVLERLAHLQILTRSINPEAGRLPQHVLDRHWSRKHGPGATYGQR